MSSRKRSRRYHHRNQNRCAQPQVASSGPQLGAEIDEVVLGAPGAGGTTFAYAQDTPILVRHGIAGEQVRLRITARQRKLAFADAIEILSAAPQRVTQIWPEAGPGGIGGAELGHVDFAYQAQWKETVLAQTMRRVGHIQDWPQTPVVQFGDSGLGQRLRAEVVITPNGELGMHRYRSEEVLPIHSLPLAHPGIYPALAQLAQQTQAKPGDRLRAVQTAAGIRTIDAAGKVQTRTGREVADRAEYSVGEDTYLAAASGFWQPHAAAAATLRDTVSAWAGSGERAVDLYCGAGLFSVALARQFSQVRGYEGDETAVKFAQENLARLVGGSDAQAAVADISARNVHELVANAQVIVADPPRSGLGKDVMNALSASTNAQKLIYVACDYAALARDLGYAQQQGWAISATRAFDFFPHTHHIETVVLLER